MIGFWNTQNENTSLCTWFSEGLWQWSIYCGLNLKWFPRKPLKYVSWLILSFQVITIIAKVLWWYFATEQQL
jgi:hypothetical protein